MAASIFRFRDHGWDLCRRILSKALPFTPHDYQLDRATHALDGIDVLAITGTGSGKSGYIYMLMHVLLVFSRNPELNPSRRKFPANPLIVVVSPTLAFH